MIRNAILLLKTQFVAQCRQVTRKIVKSLAQQKLKLEKKQLKWGMLFVETALYQSIKQRNKEHRNKRKSGTVIPSDSEDQVAILLFQLENWICIEIQTHTIFNCTA